VLRNPEGSRRLALTRFRFTGWTPSCKTHAVRRAISTNQRLVPAFARCRWVQGSGDSYQCQARYTQTGRPRVLTTKRTPRCRRNLRNRQVDAACEELKIPKIGWHSLRHSHATLLDAVGTPLGTVQSLLGHSSPEITRGTYIHSLPAGAKEAVQKVEDF